MQSVQPENYQQPKSCLEKQDQVRDQVRGDMSNDSWCFSKARQANRVPIRLERCLFFWCFFQKCYATQFPETSYYSFDKKVR